MTDLRGPYRIGAFFAFVSAALCILALVISAFANSALLLVIAALSYAVIGVGLLRGMRWLAYIAFFVFFGGGIYILAGLWTPTAIPTWLSVLAIVAHWLAVLGLFVALWRPAPTIAQV